MGEPTDAPTISYAEYIALQVQKIWSPFNRWVTGEKVGHDPTDDELARNYVENKGAEDHHQQYGPRLKL